MSRASVEKVIFSVVKTSFFISVPGSSWSWRCWRCGARPRGCPPCGAWRPSPWWPGAGCPFPAAGGPTPGRALGSGTGGALQRGWCRSPPRTAASEASLRWSPRPASRTETAAHWTTPEEDTEGVNISGTWFSSVKSSGFPLRCYRNAAFSFCLWLDFLQTSVSLTGPKSGYIRLAETR